MSTELPPIRELVGGTSMNLRMHIDAMILN